MSKRNTILTLVSENKRYSRNKNVSRVQPQWFKCVRVTKFSYLPYYSDLNKIKSSKKRKVSITLYLSISYYKYAINKPKTYYS